MVSSAAKIQCVELPSDWPVARYWFGKISEMSTQITVPWPMACAAMKAKMHAGTMAKCSREKRPRAQPERGDVAERADVEQRAPAQPVDQPEADEGEDEIRDADADGLQQRGLCAEAGQLEDARREVEDRVDAGELVEERDEEREQDGHAQPPRPEARALRPARADAATISSASASSSAARRVGLDELQHLRARARGRLSARAASAGFPGWPKHISV